MFLSGGLSWKDADESGWKSIKNHRLGRSPHRSKYEAGYIKSETAIRHGDKLCTTPELGRMR